VIYPRNALYLEPLLYQPTLVRIKTQRIYQIMETFNKFNFFTNVAMTRDPQVCYLYVQYPAFQFHDIMEILSELDSSHKAYIMTKHVFSDVFYYQWSVGKFLKSKSKK
jgi:hypothetical protein